MAADLFFLFPSGVAKKYVAVELGPTHQSARTRGERRHNAAPIIRPVGYTGQTGCRRAGRRRDQGTSPGKDPSGQSHAGLL